MFRSAFYDDLYGNTDAERSREQKQTKLMTPFFIWANYDIGSQTGVEISANYLSAFALDALGCSTSGFDQMRLAAQQSVPRINATAIIWRTARGIRQGETLSECEAADRLPQCAVRADFRPEKTDSAVVSAVKNATVCVERNGCFSSKRKAFFFLITV